MTKNQIKIAKNRFKWQKIELNDKKSNQITKKIISNSIRSNQIAKKRIKLQKKSN